MRLKDNSEEKDKTLTNKKTTKKVKKVSKSLELENIGIDIEETANSQNKATKQSKENKEVVILEKEDEFKDEINNARKKRRRSSANIE